MRKRKVKLYRREFPKRLMKKLVTSSEVPENNLNYWIFYVEDNFVLPHKTTVRFVPYSFQDKF